LAVDARSGGHALLTRRGLGGRHELVDEQGDVELLIAPGAISCA